MYKLKNVFWMKRDYPGMLLGQKSFFYECTTFAQQMTNWLQH